MHRHIEIVQLLDSKVHAYEEELRHYDQQHSQVRIDEGDYTRCHPSPSYLQNFKPSELRTKTSTSCWGRRC